MKIADEMIYDHSTDKIIHKKTYDNSDTIARVEDIKRSEINKFGSDYKFVGSVPMNLLNDWIKEAGLTWEDTNEVNEVMKKKLMSGEFDKLMAWKGF
jgi:hypothetical protein